MPFDKKLCLRHFFYHIIYKCIKSGCQPLNTFEKPLTPSEEQEYLKRYKNGDEEARQTFINGNLRLVLSVIQRFRGRGESADDLFQVGCVGLVKATDNFDVTQGVQFSTYAVPMIIRRS